jgi:hypothetical protein
MLYVSPDQGAYVVMNNVSTQKLDDMYSYGLYHIILQPNPKFEVIRIRPRDCQVFVDSILVETQCIPEPLTMVLLGMGGLFLRKRFA